jgi:hypothetical protein
MTTIVAEVKPNRLREFNCPQSTKISAIRVHALRADNCVY